MDFMYHSEKKKEARRSLAILDQLKEFFFSFYGPVRTEGKPLEEIKYHRRPFVDQENITKKPFMDLMLTVLCLNPYLLIY